MGSVGFLVEELPAYAVSRFAFKWPKSSLAPALQSTAVLLSEQSIEPNQIRASICLSA